MPYFKPELRPGINKTETSLGNEGGFSDGNLVRFFQNKPQTVGGWQLLTPQLFTGKARGAHSWSTSEGKAALAFGRSDGLSFIIGGDMRDVTVYLHDTVLEDVFTTENGSDTVTVELEFHGLKLGDSVTFSNHQETVGGLTIEGTFEVQSVPTRSTFTITASSNATSDVTTPSGGFVDILAELPSGNESNPATGYGTGTYGDGTYGASGDVLPLRVWSLDNFGENLLANPSGYGLFEFQPEILYNDLAFNGDFDGDADGWALGTGWAYDTDKVTKTAGTASNLSQNVVDVLEGGREYRVDFTVSGASAGSVAFKVNAGNPAAVIEVGEASSAITKDGTYSRRFLCPADPSDIVFAADDAFDGSISAVSYQLSDTANRVTTAPPIIDAMYVNINGVVVAIGTTTILGEYNPICVRNSDQGNVRDWTPDTDSAAAENYLRGGGGRLMAGMATRQQDIIWSDNGVFSYQFNTSDPLNGNAFSSNLLGTGCGLISRHAMAEHNGFLFWMSNAQKFYIFRGIGATNLGIPEEFTCTVKDDVFANIDQGQLLKCFAWVNTEFTEIWFHYPDTRDGSECSRVVTCAYTQEGTPWATHQLPRTAGVSSGLFAYPILMDATGKVFQHELGMTANGGNIPWFIETSAFDIREGDTLAYIDQFVPDFRDQQGNVRIDISGKLYPYDDDLQTTNFVITPTTRKSDMRISARQMRVKFSGNTTGSWMRMGAVRFNVQDTGDAR